uniref:SHSP domain-containing protein n=1 Tax=Oryzias melastigma TaxID=30732 RepID=A0A3B3DF17_ORYME
MLLQVVDGLVVVFALLVVLAEGGVGARRVQTIQEPVVKARIRRTPEATKSLAWNKHAGESRSRLHRLSRVTKLFRLLLVVAEFSFLHNIGSLSGLEDRTHGQHSQQLFTGLTWQTTGKDGQHFGLTLDTAGFSPEELSVRQVGRKLRVSGKTEKKQEDGKGSYSHRLQEFRQELDLPEGLNPEAVTCCLSPDGKLHIQAVKEEADRELSIKRSWEEEPQQRDAGTSVLHSGEDAAHCWQQQHQTCSSGGPPAA